MPDPFPQPHTGEGPDRGASAGTPRWVKVLGILGLVAVLLVVVMLVTGRGGGHGPGRHTGAGSGPSPPSSQVRAP